MPVPTSASDFTSGTAWRCMFEPMSARLASSCSRNGMSGRRRHHLARGDVHVVDVLARDVLDLAALGADQDALLVEVAVGVDDRVGLRDDVLVLLVGRQVVHLVGDAALDDLAVRRLDEAERVDPAVGGERADQTDVRALRVSIGHMRP